MIVNYLEELLNDKERNLYWLAKETGVSYSSLHRFANNPTLAVSTKTVDKVVLALNCEIQELLKVIRPQEYFQLTKERVQLGGENIQHLTRIFEENNLQVKAQDQNHYGSEDRHRFSGRFQDPAVDFDFVLHQYFDYVETSWVMVMERLDIDSQAETDHVIYLVDRYLEAIKIFCEAKGIRKVRIMRLPGSSQSIAVAMKGIIAQAGFVEQTDKTTRQTYWESFAEVQWKKELTNPYEMEEIYGANQ